MAKSPSFIFLLVFLFTIANRVATQKNLDSTFLNRTIDFSFTSKRNQTGHYINKWSLNNAGSKLPNNYKIDMKSSVTEHGGMQIYRLNVEIAVPPPRPSSYELFPGIGSYKFFPDGTLTHSQASAVCTSEGGHLAIINSEAEAEVIKIIYARYPKANRWAYLGFNDLAEEGKYVTIFGQPLQTTGYIKWREGQPDQSGGNEDCGSVHREGGLNDLPCDTHGPFPFFCEFDLAWGDY